jgi:protein SCO1/2
LTRRRLALGFGAALFVAACRSASAGEVRNDPFAGVPLVTQDGAPLAAEQYQGKTLVVSFFFTSCAVVCPAQAKVLREAALALPTEVRERVEFISVSVDPENDTTEALKRFAAKHTAGLTGFTFVRADEDGTRTLTTRLAAFDPKQPGGALPGGHTTATYLFDARGRLRQRYGGGTEAVRLAREIRQIDDISRSGG